MNLNSFLFLTLLTYILTSCKTQPETDLAQHNIIPKPVNVTASGKSFVLSENTVIYAPSSLIDVAQRLTSQISMATAFTNNIKKAGEAEGAGIHFVIDESRQWENEDAYEITIEEELINITAATSNGAFNAVQTLVQLISFNNSDDQYLIPTGTIYDFPLYPWRGAMLDVARHFFSVDDLKRYIDLLSYYKINVLHLHLTDDQGWRIEIKSWPNLALHGGSTEVGGGEGGYYTQGQYHDIVAYAQSRFITVVPEIDLPSHINAALASYGELNAGTIVPEEGRVITENPILDRINKPTELYTGIEVGWSTLRVEKDVTFRFVTDVLREVAAMTPGPYLHIGGDEAHVTKKEDYITFINRFKEIVSENNKVMIGWEEIGQANIDGMTIAQFWTNPEYIQMAADKGAKVILSPSKKIYLDMKYDSTTKLGLDWAATIEIDSSYLWDPDTYVASLDEQQILGIEAPLWSETITNMDELEYLAFPRIIAAAEVAWTPFVDRAWEDFRNRLGNHGLRLKALGVDYYPSPQIPWNDQENSRQN